MHVKLVCGARSQFPLPDLRMRTFVTQQNQDWPEYLDSTDDSKVTLRNFVVFFMFFHSKKHSESRRINTVKYP